MSRNKVIGKNNQLPWRMPADLKHFHDLTLGKSMIMGSNTFDSIGKPLPNRQSIVMTHDKNYRAEGATIVYSLDEALSTASGDEIMVIGGASIFKQFLPLTHRIYLTIIDADIEGDAFFPEIDDDEWIERDREIHESDSKNPYRYTYFTLERK